MRADEPSVVHGDLPIADLAVSGHSGGCLRVKKEASHLYKSRRWSSHKYRRVSPVELGSALPFPRLQHTAATRRQWRRWCRAKSKPAWSLRFLFPALFGLLPVGERVAGGVGGAPTAACGFDRFWNRSRSAGAGVQPAQVADGHRPARTIACVIPGTSLGGVNLCVNLMSTPASYPCGSRLSPRRSLAGFGACRRIRSLPHIPPLCLGGSSEAAIAAKDLPAAAPASIVASSMAV